MKSKATIIGIIILLLVGSGAGGYLWWHKKGGSIASQEGTGLRPLGWPEDIPYHPLAKFLSKTQFDQDLRFNVTISVKNDEVKKYYETELKKLGWELDTSTPNDIWMRWKKGPQSIAILVEKVNNETGLALMVYGKRSEADYGIKKPTLDQFPTQPSEKNAMGDLPKDIPVFQGMVAEDPDLSKSGNIRYVYRSKAQYKELIEFYHKAMLEKGFEMIADTSIKEGSFPMFQEMYKKGEITIAVRVVPDVEDRKVVYILFPKDAKIPDIGTVQKSQMNMQDTRKNKTPDQGNKKEPDKKPSTPPPTQ